MFIFYFFPFLLAPVDRTSAFHDSSWETCASVAWLEQAAILFIMSDMQTKKSASKIVCYTHTHTHTHTHHHTHTHNFQSARQYKISSIELDIYFFLRTYRAVWIDDVYKTRHHCRITRHYTVKQSIQFFFNFTKYMEICCKKMLMCFFHDCIITFEV